MLIIKKIKCCLFISTLFLTIIGCGIPQPSLNYLQTKVKVETKYVLNTSTKKIHKPNCSSVKNMLEKNKEEYTGDIAKIIDKGYKKCGKCKPI